MGNFCSIYHNAYETLEELTNNHNQAVFLDKCLFWWQISKYTLDDQKIWFTRTVPEMAKEASVSERSISRFLKEFVRLGLLEKTCKLSGAYIEGKYTVTKKLYIRVTDKLLALVQVKPKKINASPNTNQNNPNILSLNQDGVIENANLAFPINKDNNLNCFVSNTTVSNDSIVDKQNPKFKTYPIEAHIGERLSLREKNYIKGVMHQITQSDSTLISNPNQLFAEIVFAVTNEHQFKGITNFNHKLQIISKLIRTRRWMTPKGFYNHCDFGRLFKAPDTKIPDAAPSSSSQTNKPSTPQARIKELKSALLEATSERCSNESYLCEMLERAQRGHEVSQAVLDSIQSKITKSAALERDYTQALHALSASQQQEGRAVPITPIQSNWAQYDALCAQQRGVEKDLERASAAYEKALHGGLSPDATQKATDDYLYCIEQYELINEELFQLGELLNQKKSA